MCLCFPASVVVASNIVLSAELLYDNIILTIYLLICNN